MPYVNVPNDLSKVKTKMALNLTKRQLICFSCAAAVGIPSYLLARGSIGNTGAMFLMLAVMLPAFLPVSYTHLDVYKRQYGGSPQSAFYRQAEGQPHNEGAYP